MNFLNYICKRIIRQNFIMKIEIGSKLLIKSAGLRTITVTHIIDENSKEPWYLGKEKDNETPILFFPRDVCIDLLENKC